MAGIVAPILSNFNAGQLSPLLDGRVDLAKYPNGAYRMENFIPTVQGPCKRRMGFRFEAEVRNGDDRTWLRRFIFSESQAFILEFGPLYIRFFTNQGPVLESPKAITGITQANPGVVTSNAHGFNNGDEVFIEGVQGMRQVNGRRFYVAGVTANTFQLLGTNTTTFDAYTSGGTVSRVYQIASPWNVGQLTNSNGTFKLEFAQKGDALFIASGIYPLHQLTRLGNTNWVLSIPSMATGPFEDVDPDQTITIQASASAGAITLTASSAIFTPELVGWAFLIEQPRVDSYPAWEVNKSVTAGSYYRSDLNVYQAQTTGTTGTIKPTHLDGTKMDGATGVSWRYVHSGYGTVRITSASGTTATATVLTELPSLVVSGPTTRWARPSWNDVDGYPTHVTFFRERMALFRKARGWFSVAGDPLDHSAREGSETVPDSAASIEITASELNDCTFLAPASDLLVGTLGGEFSVGELSSQDVFGPGNISAKEQTKHGSRQIPPARINDSILMWDKTGRRLRDLRFTFDSEGYQTTDLQVMSTDIMRGQAVQHAFQEEPDSVLWVACKDGRLVGFTFNREQDVIGWHSHPIQWACESVEVIPGDGQDVLWAIGRFTINGVTKRYIMQMDPDWRADISTLDECLYSDAGATFSGMDQPGTITVDAAFNGVDTSGDLTASLASFFPEDVGDWVVIEASTNRRCRFMITEYTSPTVVVARQMDDLPPGFDPGDVSSDWSFGRDVIAGLEYLEGREVSLIGDGASHPNVTVEDGRIQLQRHVRTAQVGLPMPAEVETMRIEAGSQNGTSQGKTKRIHRLIMRFFETLGGRFGARGSDGVKVLDQILFRQSSDPMNQPPSLFTGDKDQEFPGDYGTEARIIVQADQPLPMTIIALMPQLETHDRV